MRPTARAPQKKESRMQRRHMYCRLMPLLTSTYQSTKKWGRALYTHQQMEMASGELVVDPTDSSVCVSIEAGASDAHRQADSSMQYEPCRGRFGDRHWHEDTGARQCAHRQQVLTPGWVLAKTAEQ